MTLKYEFIPQGSVIVPSTDGWRYRSLEGELRVFDPAATVICDVGNQLAPGIIDQHAPDTEKLCTTSLLAARPNYYLGALNPRAKQVSLVTHLDPDFDAAAALFLARHFVEHGRLPDWAPELADYAQNVDSGLLQLDPEAPFNPAAAVLTIGLMTPPHRNRDEYSRRILLEVFRFFEAWPGLLQRQPDPSQEDFLEGLSGFEAVRKRIEKDREIYWEDIRLRSEFMVLQLPNQATGAMDRVDGIVTYRPRSILWKYWTRRDRQHSRFGQGFPVTCAFFDTFAPRTRAIIATNPNLPYDLKGLGVLLERLELDALRNIGIDDAFGSEPRPGFLRANPWYDGRNPLHRFTIIDAPRGGSVLTPTAIKSSLQREDLWVDLRNAFNQDNTLNPALIQHLPV